MVSARVTTYNVLQATDSGAKLDDALESVGRGQNAEETSRDLRYTRNLVKTVLRNRTFLDFSISKYAGRPVSKIDGPLRNIIRMGVVELHHFATADYAAISEAVDLARTVRGKKAAGFINAVLRNAQRTGQIYPENRLKLKNPTRYLSVLYSHPEWLVKRWLNRYGFDRTETILKRNNSPAPTSVVISPGIEIGDIELEAEKSGGSISSGMLDTYALVPGCSLSAFKPFVDGNILIVDPSSTLGVKALNPPKNVTVVDCAAGVGGKTIQFAFVIGIDGRVVAIDNNRPRLERLRSNLIKYGLSNVSIVCADLTLQIADVPQYALLDAPCSNSGVMRRKPDVRWRLRPDDITKSAILQKRILEKIWSGTKSGCKLVYQTCSVEPEENEDVIKWAIANLPNVKVLNAAEKVGFETNDNDISGPFISTIATEYDCNGAFVALLQRK